MIPAGVLTAEDLGRVHLIGVGGVGMSGLARLLLTRGIPVSGSELREWPALAGAAGARRHHPHDATSRPIWTVSTRSSTPPRSRPTTWSWSRRGARGLRVLHRSEALAAAMTGRRRSRSPAPTARPPPPRWSR